MEKSGSVKNSNTIKTMTPVIEIEHISKRYGKTEALHDVSFTVQRGELFGLIGPDGAGKSTLFRILTTLLNADSGKASVLNYDVCHDFRTIYARTFLTLSGPDSRGESQLFRNYFSNYRNRALSSD